MIYNINICGIRNLDLYEFILGSIETQTFVLLNKYKTYVILSPHLNTQNSYILKFGCPGSPISSLTLPGACLDIKMSSYQYRNSHYKDKGVSTPTVAHSLIWYASWCYVWAVRDCPCVVNICHEILGPISTYCKTTNIRRTLVGNKIADHSDVVGAWPVGAAPTTSPIST